MYKLVRKEFIFDDPIPTPECHASTLLKTSTGHWLAAWFAGTKEANPDVLIWSSYYRNGQWSKPRPITDEVGIQHWNPVLFQADKKRILLFYKLGYPIAAWKTMLLQSEDEGESWISLGEMVPGDTSGGRGPVKNKAIRLRDGHILAPGSTEQIPWRPFVDVSNDHGAHWGKHSIPVVGEGSEKINMIQPSLWESAPGQVHAFMRTNQGKIYRSDSADGGKNWCSAYPTALPNNNSGLDCVQTKDGRLVLVCNPIGEDWGVRTPLSVLVSTDNGQTFEHALDLETEKNAGEFSYPAIIAEGKHLYITYTWKRKKIVFAELEDC